MTTTHDPKVSPPAAPVLEAGRVSLQPSPYGEVTAPFLALLGAREARIRELEAELARLREVEAAARAFVESAEDPYTHVVVDCGICNRIATTMSGGKTRCDDHPNGGDDLDYAPAWRRLRKAVGR